MLINWCLDWVKNEGQARHPLAASLSCWWRPGLESQLLKWITHGNMGNSLSDMLAQKIVQPDSAWTSGRFISRSVQIKWLMYGFMSVWVTSFQMSLWIYFTSKLFVFTTMTSIDSVRNCPMQDVMWLIQDMTYFLGPGAEVCQIGHHGSFHCCQGGWDGGPESAANLAGQIHRHLQSCAGLNGPHSGRSSPALQGLNYWTIISVWSS